MQGRRPKNTTIMVEPMTDATTDVVVRSTPEPQPSLVKVQHSIHAARSRQCTKGTTDSTNRQRSEKVASHE